MLVAATCCLRPSISRIRSSSSAASVQPFSRPCTRLETRVRSVGVGYRGLCKKLCRLRIHCNADRTGICQPASAVPVCYYFQVESSSGYTCCLLSGAMTRRHVLTVLARKIWTPYMEAGEQTKPVAESVVLLIVEPINLVHYVQWLAWRMGG